MWWAYLLNISSAYFFTIVTLLLFSSPNKLIILLFILTQSITSSNSSFLLHWENWSNLKGIYTSSHQVSFFTYPHLLPCFQFPLPILWIQVPRWSQNFYSYTKFIPLIYFWMCLSSFSPFFTISISLSNYFAISSIFWSHLPLLCFYRESGAT
jgi:hypothetical protein